MFDLHSLIRPNIRDLEPYKCARDAFTEGILLDANENTIGPALSTVSVSDDQLKLNRYPDPHQIVLKRQIASMRNANPILGYLSAHPLTPENLCLGVGSDENIDMLMRCVCTPGRDKIMICPPTYGMYSICAKINNLEISNVPLTYPDFQVDRDAVIAEVKADSSIKLIYITSPGNPTGKLVLPTTLLNLCKDLANVWNGLLVVDEAYIDFNDANPTKSAISLSTQVNYLPNLVVLQTLSKLFGLAGVRLGISFSLSQLSRYLNSMKYPYNISTMASAIALRATSDSDGLPIMKGFITSINEQRDVVVQALRNILGTGRIIGGLDANFVLVEILNRKGNPSNEAALKVYSSMAVDTKVVVRFRGKELNCEGALRISIGTKLENQVMLEKLALCIENIDQ